MEASDILNQFFYEEFGIVGRSEQWRDSQGTLRASKLTWHMFPDTIDMGQGKFACGVEFISEEKPKQFRAARPFRLCEECCRINKIQQENLSAELAKSAPEAIRNWRKI